MLCLQGINLHERSGICIVGDKVGGNDSMKGNGHRDSILYVCM